MGRKALDAQNIHSSIPQEEVKALFPDECKVCFYPPPFETVQTYIDRGETDYWFRPEVKLHEIDPLRVLILGDFGIGSDTVFGLDYRWLPPRVMKLQWDTGWVTVAKSFAEFSEMFKLEHRVWANT